MLEQIVTISLIITAIHVSMWDGMIFAGLRRRLCGLLEALRLGILRKPLCECLICMGGVYSVVIYLLLYGLAWQIIPVTLGVIGLNSIVSTSISKMRDE